MRNYRTETTTRITLESIVCDRCKTEYKSSIPFFSLEEQEFLMVDKTAGYDSIFGDGVHFSLDLCQYCFHKLLGDYCQIDS